MSDVFGKRLGQYILLEQLGEGGMAKVYNALDSRAERNVAIKVILPNKRSSSIFLQQFEQEAKSLANLIHTNIVKVLNYGVEDGQPYLVMEFIPGGTLKESMQRPIQWQTAAAILAPIARALEYVHRQQIVHRDVKPSNILLDDEFHPMLSDFGIVKLLESKDEANSAAIGVGVGTPDYMPPEQGLGKDVDFRADIYSLGLVYYEMVTGRKPFAADTPMAAVIRHITDELPLPSTVDRSIPRFVEQAMMRAIQKNPDDRYTSMGAFAEVLELLALGREAPVKKIAQLSRKKKERKSPSKYFIMILIPVLLSLSALGFWYFSAQPTGETTPMSAPISAGTQAKSTQPSDSQAAATATEADAVRLTEVVEATSESPTKDPITGITLINVPISRNGASQFQEIARWGIGGVNSVDWSPDGSTLALGTTSGMFLYNAESKQLIRFIDTGYNVILVKFSPAGDTITAGSLDGQSNAWFVETGKVAHGRGNTSAAVPATVIFYSKQGNNLAVGYADGNIQYYKDSAATPVTFFQHPTVTSLAISNDNRFLYVGNGENRIFVWDIALKKVDSEWTSPAPVQQLIASANGQFLLTAGNGNSAYLWDIGEGRVVSSFANLGGLVTDLKFSSNDEKIAIGLNNGSIKIFATPGPDEYSKAKQPLVTLQGLSEKPHSITFSPDFSSLAAGNWKDGLKIWDAETGTEQFTLPGHMAAVRKLYFSPDGTWLTTGHEDNIVRVWKVKDSTETYTFDGYLPNGLPFSLDKRFITIAQPAQEKYRLDTLKVVELSSGNVVAELPDYERGSLVQFTSDSKLLIVGNNHAANLWDVSTWERLDTHGGMNAGCGQYFTPQNNRLVVIHDASALFTYDKKIQDMCGTKPAGTTMVYYFEKEHRIFFVLGDGKLWDWDFASAEIANIRSAAPYPFVEDVFLTADQASGWYAYAFGDALYFQNVNSNTPAKTILGQQLDYRYRVALLPGQNLMALGSQYGSIHIWTMP